MNLPWAWCPLDLILCIPPSIWDKICLSKGTFLICLVFACTYVILFYATLYFWGTFWHYHKTLWTLIQFTTALSTFIPTLHTRKLAQKLYITRQGLQRYFMTHEGIKPKNLLELTTFCFPKHLFGNEVVINKSMESENNVLFFTEHFYHKKWLYKNGNLFLSRSSTVAMYCC